MRSNQKIIMLKTPFKGEGDGDSGDNTSTVVNIKETSEFKDAVAAAIAANDKDSKGLQSKNDELLTKLAEAKTTLKTFEGIDPEETKKLMEAINQSEETKLISEGKIDEVIANRTDSIQQKFQDDLNGLNENLKSALSERDGFKSELDTNKIGDEIQLACIKLGVLPGAILDVKTRAKSIFSVSKETKDIESRLSNGEFRKTTDDMLMTPERFVESLKTEVPHYWPASQGSGSQGNNFGHLSEADGMAKLTEISQGANGKLDMDKYRAERKKLSPNSAYTGRG
jgi:DNA-directed RNA polymerase subunit F